MKTKYPKDAVVVRVPRVEMPTVFIRNDMYDASDRPYQRVSHYNLVVVPAGVVQSQIGTLNLMDYGFIYSAKSNWMYEWLEYYTGEWSRREADVGAEKVFVECIPNKPSHHNPPSAVNVYASTAGVVWLALRACEPGDWSPGPSAARLVELDDVPFAIYFDLIEELPGDADSRDRLRAKLNLFFGACPV